MKLSTADKSHINDGHFKCSPLLCAFSAQPAQHNVSILSRHCPAAVVEFYSSQSFSIHRQYLVSLQFSSLFVAASFHLPALAAQIQHNKCCNGVVPPYKENKTAGGLEFILYTEILQILTVITSLYQPPRDLFLSLFPGAFPLQDM
jgi:hypothetical protein